MAEAKRQQQRLDTERQKLLDAHYAGAVPLDMLKREMTRLTRELHDADKLAQSVTRSQEELMRLLNAALALCQHCYELYETVERREQRMFNQGFFTKLSIAQDGSVQHAELQEPFAQLLARDETVTIEHSPDPVVKALGHSGLELAATGTDGASHELGLHSRGQREAAERARCSASAVLLSFTATKRTQLTLSSNKQLLAVAEGFEPPDGVSRLSLSRRVH